MGLTHVTAPNSRLRKSRIPSPEQRALVPTAHDDGTSDYDAAENGRRRTRILFEGRSAAAEAWGGGGCG